jgi:hypothetical protein
VEEYTLSMHVALVQSPVCPLNQINLYINFGLKYRILNMILGIVVKDWKSDKFLFQNFVCDLL